MRAHRGSPPSHEYRLEGDRSRIPHFFAFGPPAIDWKFGAVAHTVLRSVTVAYAVVLHAVLGIGWGWRVAWIIAGFAFIHLVVVVPVLTSRKSTDGFGPIAIDTAAVAVGGLFGGVPGFTLPWVVVIMFTAGTFVRGRRALWLMAGAASVPLASVAGSLAPWHEPPPPGVAAAYLWAGFGLVAIYTVLTALAMGAAVRRREVELERVRERESALMREMSAQAAQIRTLTEGSPIGLALQNPAGRFVYHNARFAEIVGLPDATIRRTGVVDAMTPSVRTHVEAELVGGRSRGEPVRLEHPVILPDGRKRWVEIYSRPISDDRGTLLGHAITLLDRTGEAEARERSHRIARLLEVTSDLAVIWDEGGHILHANRAFSEFFDADPDEIERMQIDSVLPRSARVLDPRDRPQPGLVREEEITFTDATGFEVPFSVVVGSFGNDLSGGEMFAAVARDISESKATNQRLQALLSSKDQFIASVSHELRTPLTAVVGLAFELADRAGIFTENEIAEFCRTIAEQSAEVAAIVEDLLTAARADAGVLTIALEPTDLVGNARSALVAVPADFRDRVELAMSDEIPVVADAGRVRQIVRNLLTNARRYGGDRVRLESCIDGDHGIVRVRDSGPPIPAEQRLHMFEAYGRLQKSMGTPDSVGLGLTVSRQLARMMGGDVAYDHVDGWSTFTLSVPIRGEVAGRGAA